MNMKIESDYGGKPLTYGELQRALEVLLSINPALEQKIATLEIDQADGYITHNHIVKVITSTSSTRIVGRQPK